MIMFCSTNHILLINITVLDMVYMLLHVCFSLEICCPLPVVFHTNTGMIYYIHLMNLLKSRKVIKKHTREILSMKKHDKGDICLLHSLCYLLL